MDMLQTHRAVAAFHVGAGIMLRNGQPQHAHGVRDIKRYRFELSVEIVAAASPLYLFNCGSHVS